MHWTGHEKPAPPDHASGGEHARTGRAAHTFLVRLWKETRAKSDDKPVWRGTLSDLRGKQLGSFSSAAELVGILGEISGPDLLLRISCVETATPSAGTP